MGRLDRLIERIYDGGVSDAAWRDIVPGIVEACRARSAVLLISNRTTGQLAFADECGLGTDYRRAYLEDLRRDDLRFDDLMRQPLGTLRTDQMIQSYDRYLASRAYRELYSKLGTEHAMGAFLWSDGRSDIGLRLFRSCRDGAFAEAEVESYRQLMPHLARSFRLRALASRDRRQRRALDQTFDRLPWALLLLDGEGALLAGNAAGRDWLAGGSGEDPGAGPDGGPRGESSGGKGRAQGLRRLALQAFGEQARSGKRQFAALLPGDGGATARLRLDLLPAGDPWLAASEAAALVSFVPEAAAAGPPPGLATLLRLLYDLTESEARLAARLAAGEALADCARALGIRPETARTHLRNVFAKTGTRRQSELVRLVLAGPAALAS